MLALTPEELAPTDTTDAAIEAIAASGIREIVDARPARAGAGRVHDAGAQGARRARGRRRDRRPRRARARPGQRGGARARHERAAQPRGAARVRRARAGGQAEAARAALPASRRSRSSASERVEAVELVRNELVDDGRGGSRAVAGEERETIPCGLVFRSVGYHGVPLPDVPFDESRGTMPNEGGRVLDGSGGPIPASTAPAGSSAARAA